jgi:hypothetical protein
MRIRSIVVLITFQFGLLLSQSMAVAYAQQRIALKNGESVDLGPVYYISNCRSIMIGMPEVEVLDGPDEVKLTLREEMVLPRTQNCAKKVPGGILVLTAKEVQEPSQATLTYRVKYQTKDGLRQRSVTYNVSLFP